MKYIKKSKEPISLTTYKSTPNATYDSFASKDDIRNSLIEEQGAICAYCMRRISNKWNSDLNKYSTEIEHVKPQSRYPKLSLNYDNMLGVCNGNAGQPKHKLHCDKSKGNIDITINPLNLNCEKIISFTKDGRIKSDIADINKELNEILNLNENTLKRNRGNVIFIAINSIKKEIGNKEWNKTAIKKEKAKWEKLYKSGYREYCQAVIFILNKRLKRAN